MKPIRFFRDQQTVWYNLSDYVQLLLDTQTIHNHRPLSLHKRKPRSKSVYQIVLEKVDKLNPIYQQQFTGDIYVDWVIFEHLYRLIRPFLARPADWSDNERIFKQIQSVVEHPKQAHQGSVSDVINTYFLELKKAPPSTGD